MFGNAKDSIGKGELEQPRGGSHHEPNKLAAPTGEE